MTKLPNSNRSFVFRLRNSLSGLWHVTRHESNMRIHLAAMLVVLVLGIYLKIDRYEWSIIVICCGGVIAAECFNTAVERLADRVEPEFDPLIGTAKDCAAAAVVCWAIAAAVVGLIIFVSKLI